MSCQRTRRRLSLLRENVRFYCSGKMSDTREMGTITLNDKQQRRAEVLNRLEAGTLDVGTAADILGVGVRQVRQLRARLRQESMIFAIHGNTGRESTSFSSFRGLDNYPGFHSPFCSAYIARRQQLDAVEHGLLTSISLGASILYWISRSVVLGIVLIRLLHPPYLRCISTVSVPDIGATQACHEISNQAYGPSRASLG